MAEKLAEEVFAAIQSRFSNSIVGEVTVFTECRRDLLVVKAKKENPITPLGGGLGEMVDLDLRYTDEEINDLTSASAPLDNTIPISATLGVQQSSRGWGVSFLFDLAAKQLILQLTHQDEMPALHPGWNSYWEEVRINIGPSGLVSDIYTFASKVKGSGKEQKEELLFSNFVNFPWGDEESAVDVVNLRKGSPQELMFSELSLPTRFEKGMPLVTDGGETVADQAVYIYQRLFEGFQSVSETPILK